LIDYFILHVYRRSFLAYKRKWAKQQQFHQQQQQQHLVRQYLSGHPQLHGIAAAVAAAQAQNIDYREGGGDGTIGFCGPPPQILQVFLKFYNFYHF
jgi:hypothetical protein